jgi:hypothetical protein
MIRKFFLAFAAIAALGTVALTTPASAKHWGKHHHHFHGSGLYFGSAYYPVGYYGSCYRTRWVLNRFGELVPRRVNVCY